MCVVDEDVLQIALDYIGVLSVKIARLEKQIEGQVEYNTYIFSRSCTLI